MVQYWQLSSFNILNFNVNGVLNFYDIKIISRREDLIKNVNHSVDDEIRWKLQPVSCWWWSANGDSPPCCRSSLNVCGARDRSRLSPHRARVSPSHTQIPFTVRRTSGSVQFSLHLTAERLSETQRVGGQCEGPVRGPAGGGGEGAVPGQQADLPWLAPSPHLQDHQTELHLLEPMLWVPPQPSRSCDLDHHFQTYTPSQSITSTSRSVSRTQYQETSRVTTLWLWFLREIIAKGKTSII